MSAPPLRRDLILRHLTSHPDQTSRELARVIGSSDSLLDLLRRMERKGLVTATAVWRPRTGRQASVWRVAPPGTLPPPPRAVSPDWLERRRERDRLSQRRRRARARGLPAPEGDGRPRRPGRRPDPVLPAVAPWALPPDAACRGADPALFFPRAGESGAEAAAICAACPIRGECYALAVRNGETCGIWGGVNFADAAGGAR